jgi:hypothetical protein
MDGLDLRLDFFNLSDKLQKELLLRSVEVKLLNFFVGHLPLPVTIAYRESRCVVHTRHVRFIRAVRNSSNDNPLGTRYFETSDL